MKINNLLKRKKIFTRYLKENNLYEKFLNNCHSSSNYNLISLELLIDYIIRFNQMFKNDDNKCTEMMLFDWNESKEGFNFWSKENKIWENVLSLIINN